MNPWGLVTKTTAYVARFRGTCGNSKTHSLPSWRRYGLSLKAGFHMIADDRGSQIADRRKFCDRLRSYGNTLLRSCDRDRRRSQTIAEDRTMFYLLRSSAIICDCLRSCDHMETKVLRSAIEMYPIIFLILTDDSTFLSHKARMFDYSNAHLL